MNNKKEELQFCGQFTYEEKIKMLDWMKKYSEAQNALQEEINNDPDAFTLYTYEIDVDTLKITARETRELDYDEDVTGYAEYEQSCTSNRVYAESLVSPEDAKTLVRNFCLKFSDCIDIIDKEDESDR